MIHPELQPLTRLTSSKVPFTWPLEVHTAFTTVKELFASTSILIHPNTTKQFIIEVDVRTPVSGQSFPSGPGLKVSSSHSPTSHADSPLRREIMT